ncbi:MAG TPA: heme o synthase, partial [Tepidisphaeraceae bacterium]|nr:heme o synthase [Tepidisphaeraceae bacterium]
MVKPTSINSPLREDFATADCSALSSPSTSLSRLRDFYELTKPRMNFLVVITTAVGYYLAVRHSFEWLNLLNAIVGTTLTAAGASVLNQHAERKYDARMRRTADRPLPAGRVASREALIFGIALALAGTSYLALAVNGLTATLGAATLLSYVLIYTPMKRHTSLCTVIGAIPGAIPPVMGWTAVHNALSPEAVTLFIVLFLWQIPHFLAIAILYRDDYAAAGFKMLPVVDHDMAATSRQIVLYSVSLIPATLLPAALHMAGLVYFAWALLLGVAFASLSVTCARTRSRSDA